jgi:predicted molibdopterin-dependent oxidoreductase YjgC
VDPQETKLSPFSHLWLRPRVGTDTALLNGMASAIVAEGLQNEEFVARKTDNFEALADNLSNYTPDQVEEITGVPAEELRRAARMFAEANLASIVCGDGLTQQVNGTDSIAALANLAMLTGNIGPRGGIFALQRDSNGLGASDMGALPDLLPGYQCAEEEQPRSKFAQRWNAEVPSVAGLTAIEMIQDARNGGVKGMYIVGENPVLSFPNSALVREALGSLDFLVVQDMFLSETAALAHVVLPAASFAEKEGTFTNFEGRVQRVRKAIPPRGDSLPDWEIVLRLAERMGCEVPYSSLQQVVSEIQEMVPLYQAFGNGEREARDVYRPDLDRDPLRARRLYKGQFPKGFGRFSPVQYEPRAVGAGDGYDLMLLAGSVLYHSGTGSRSSRSQRLSEFASDAYVEIGESDAKRIGIAEGEQVRVKSPVGEVAAAARFTGRLPEGTVFMPLSFPSAPVNQLFDGAIDPRVKTPALKACAVKLERV